MERIAGSKQSILTLDSLLKAIKECDLVYTQIRLGVAETWVKISKKEARRAVAVVTKFEILEDFGLDKFGSLEVDAITMEKVLYLG